MPTGASAGEAAADKGVDQGEGAAPGSLLGYGILAGPFYLILGLAQALLREGFDFARHPLSLLANGPGGWVQTLNFVATGLMVIAAAVGVGRVLRPQSRAAGWVLGFFGASMIAAAVFPADPVDGFPPGTPEGFPTTVSTPGLLHFAAGGTGFLALAVSGVVVGLALRRRQSSTMAAVSIISGVAVGLGFFGPMFGVVPGGIAGIWAAVVIGFAWLALTSAYLSRTARGRAG